MIKASCRGKRGQRIAILGLSDSNLRMLRDEGRPFYVRFAEVGMDVELIVMWGVTDQAMIEELARNGIHLPS